MYREIIIMFLGGLPLLIVLFLLFVAAALWVAGRRMRRESGLPDGRVFYTDTETWRAHNDVLHAADLRLGGKPDYLVAVSYAHLRATETVIDLVCRLLLTKKII